MHETFSHNNQMPNKRKDLIISDHLCQWRRLTGIHFSTDLMRISPLRLVSHARRLLARARFNISGTDYNLLGPIWKSIQELVAAYYLWPGINLYVWVRLIFSAFILGTPFWDLDLSLKCGKYVIILIWVIISIYTFD